MLNSPVPQSAWAQGAWAELRTGDRVTRYRRRGVGQPLLVLRAHDDAPLWSALSDALCTRYRILIPELGDAERWDSRRILEFLEGLGCSRVIVIGDAHYARAILELKTSCFDQVARLVVVGVSHAISPTPAANGGIPALIVDAGPDTAAVIKIVTEFLETHAAPDAA